MANDVSANLRQFENLLGKDKNLSKMYDDLPEGKKQIILEAVVKGKVDIKALTKACADLNKTERELSKSNVGMASSFVLMAKSASALISPITESAKAYNDYASSLQRMGSSSQMGTSGLKKMRSELSLMKSEMGSFFEVSNRLFVQGFDSKKIESTFKDLRKTFGNEAMKMASELANVLQKTPTLRANPKAPISSKDWVNVLESGQGSQVMQFQKMGLFGGKPSQGNKNAEFANRVKNVEALKERVKDYASSGIPAEVAITDSILKEVTSIAENVKVMAQFFSSAKSLGQGALSAAQAGGLGSGAGASASTESKTGRFRDPKTGRFRDPKTGRFVKAPGAGGGLLRGVGRALPFAMAGYDVYEGRQQGKGWGESVGTAGAGLAGGLAGAKLGALAGTALGPIGTVAGGLIGGAVGYAGAKWGAGKMFGNTDKGLLNEPEPVSKEEAQRNELAGRINKYEQISSFARRQDSGAQFKRETAMSEMTFAGMKGNQGDLQTQYQKAQEATETFFSEQTKNLKDSEKDNNEKIAIYKRMRAQKKSSGQDTSQIDTLLEQAEATQILIDKEFANAQLQKIEKYREGLEKIMAETSRGGLDLLTLSGAKASAGVKVSESFTKGGQEQAFRGAKISNVAFATKEKELAATNISSMKSALAQEEAKKGKKDKEGNDLYDPLKVATAQKALNDATVAYGEKVENLNSALKDMRAFEYISMKLEAMSSVTNTLSGYLETINGSWEAMGPIMQEQIKLSEQSLQNAKNKVEELKKSGASEGSEEMIKARASAANEEVNLAKQRFDFAKKERDIKIQEHEVASSIMKEQSDFLADMGGHFSDVLAMKAQAFEEDRKAIDHQKNFIETSGVKGLEKEKAIADLKRKEMELARNTIGFQKSVYEKFVGFAFGALSDKGYKTGRMDASVLMGVDKTRTKNRAGIYIGENDLDANRDNLSAFNALGGPKSDFESVNGVQEAKDSTEKSAENIKTGGEAILEAAKIFAGGKVVGNPSSQNGTAVLAEGMKKGLENWSKTSAGNGGGNVSTGAGTSRVKADNLADFRAKTEEAKEEKSKASSTQREREDKYQEEEKKAKLGGIKKVKDKIDAEIKKTEDYYSKNKGGSLKGYLNSSGSSDYLEGLKKKSSSLGAEASVAEAKYSKLQKERFARRERDDSQKERVEGRKLSEISGVGSSLGSKGGMRGFGSTGRAAIDIRSGNTRAMGGNDPRSDNMNRMERGGGLYDKMKAEIVINGTPEFKKAITAKTNGGRTSTVS